MIDHWAYWTGIVCLWFVAIWIGFIVGRRVGIPIRNWLRRITKADQEKALNDAESILLSLRCAVFYSPEAHGILERTHLRVKIRRLELSRTIPTNQLADYKLALAKISEVREENRT